MDFGAGLLGSCERPSEMATDTKYPADTKSHSLMLCKKTPPSSSFQISNGGLVCFNDFKGEQSYRVMASSSSSSSGSLIKLSYIRSVLAKHHVDEIRKQKFSIGEEHPNPLTEDLHNAVTNLSSELYSKDVHFLMELIQNAEDNEYLPGVEPMLEFVLTTTDVTGVGAPATLLVFNNEVGFSKKNIESLCSIGHSTKKGQRHQGFIGEKGIGFKSVFLVSALPHIFSNGYQIKFSEAPNQDCGIGYIVPEWVVAKPTISDVQMIYGSGKILPTTTIILPLKAEKVEAVKKKLSEIHPEILLFLCKIKKLLVWENSGGSCSKDTVSAISISSETNQISSSTQGADSQIVHLSVREKAETTEAACRYYIWRQVFPVNPENMVDARRGMKEWVISLAFPFGERLKREISSVGIFAFLPTAMVTNFPFILQADFILASSRENILLDNQWNKGILNNVSSTFVDALTTCMKSCATTECFSLAQVLAFLPVKESPYKELNVVRQSIKTMLQEECIVPYESFLNEKMVFCKPCNIIRVLPEFRLILLRIKEHNGYLSGFSSLGKFILQQSVDKIEYDETWNFLGVPNVCDCYEWYGKCVQTLRLMCKASIDVYAELLCFVADNWKHMPLRTFNNIPLFKYITWNKETEACSILQIRREKLKIHLVWEVQEHAWLSKWNLGMGCPCDMFFFPDSIVTALLETGRKRLLCQWLTKVGVVDTNVSKYYSKLGSFIRISQDPKLAISFSHFIYHSSLKNYLRLHDMSTILSSMPIVNGSGDVVMCTKTLVPASGSKWVKLFCSNYLFDELLEKDEACYLDNYAVLGTVYADAAEIAGECTWESKLLNFLKKHAKTRDLLDILPQDAVLRVASTQLTNDQAILLLDWLRSLRVKKYEMPVKFIESIRNGKWLKTYSGFNSPNRCFLSDGTEKSTLLEMGKNLKVSSTIDEGYYRKMIGSYKDELVYIGVKIGSEELHQLILDFIKPLASSKMSRSLAISMLGFIKYLQDNNKPNEDLLKCAKEGTWLKTNHGFRNPVGSVFAPSKYVDALLQITDLCVVDRKYYEGQLDFFVDELKLLGVLVHIGDVYKIIPKHLTFPEDLSTMKKETALFLLRCVRHLGPEAIGLTLGISRRPWINTTSGLQCPFYSLLLDDRWAYFLDVVSLPIIDVAFYGSEIWSYKAELEAVGVVTDADGAYNIFSDKLESLLSTSILSSATVISLLKCVQCMRVTLPSKLDNLKACLSGKKWLKTSHGYNSARDSIFFDSKWGAISQFVDLPLLDEAFYGADIQSFKDELKLLGVVFDFEDGAQFVARGLKMPKDPTLVTPLGALSLLKCVWYLPYGIGSSNQSLLVGKLRGSKWLKTHMGYRSPEESAIFNPDWESYLEQHDAPFIDKEFYGSLLSVYVTDLMDLGVKADTEEVCSLIFETLTSHTQNSSSIMRIYKFLNKFEWVPKSCDKISSQVWIPNQDGTDGGKWVSSRLCVLHQRGTLFGSRRYALDKYYDKELLPFFPVAFKVAEAPSIDDYMNLWNVWVVTRQILSLAECRSFWEYISGNWDVVTKSSLITKMTLVPATTNHGDFEFVEKEEVFIPDDLQLKKLFTEASGKPLFVWLPEKRSLSPTHNKMVEIYTSLGVQKISEAAKLNPSRTLPMDSELQKMDPIDGLIGKSLIKIVLAFLANNLVTMEADERHKAAQSLLDLSVFETDVVISDSYSLHLPLQRRKLDVESKRMVLWQKHPNRLLVQKSGLKSRKENAEFVTTFAREISLGLLPNRTDLADSLCKLIQMGFAFGFKEDAVDYLMMTENLEELSVEDKVFLNHKFPHVKPSRCVSVKRLITSLKSPSPPKTPNYKRLKQQQS